jgi:hypothetical protein
MKSKLVQIFFFNGDEVQTTEVLYTDLPKLAGARTFWRESIPDVLRGVLLKKKIALEFKKRAKTLKTAANIE